MRKFVQYILENILSELRELAHEWKKQPENYGIVNYQVKEGIMKMLRKLTVFLLVFVLAFSFACKAKTAEPAVAEVTATPEPTPEPALDQDLAILYTNDVHCAVDERHRICRSRRDEEGTSE